MKKEHPRTPVKENPSPMAFVVSLVPAPMPVPKSRFEEAVLPFMKQETQKGTQSSPIRSLTMERREVGV